MNVAQRSQRDSSYALKTVLVLWGTMRILVQFPALFASHLRPLTEIERLIPLWPPAAPLHTWLYRVLLAPWQRWDVEWYLRILTEGYKAGNGTDAFHPLYPWLAYPLTLLGMDPLLALMVVSNLATLAFLFLFVRLSELDAAPSQTRTVPHLLLSFPLAFILFAPYNESLFLVLSVAMFLCLRQHRWWWAGLAGALAVLTRQQGLLLVFPFAWELWATHKGDVRDLLRGWRSWSAMGLIPIGLVLWVVYRALVIGGVQLNVSSPYALVYSMLIAPSADKVGAAHIMMWPWQALRLALLHLWVMPDVGLVVNLLLSAVFVGALLAGWLRLRVSYRVYVMVTTLVSFSYHTGRVHPYMGLPRHLFLAFPVFMGLGQAKQRNWQRLLWIGGGWLGMFFLVLLYVLETWVP